MVSSTLVIKTGTLMTSRISWSKGKALIKASIPLDFLSMILISLLD